MKYQMNHANPVGGSEKAAPPPARHRRTGQEVIGDALDQVFTNRTKRPRGRS